MKKEKEIYLFPLFWIGLIMTTYFGVGEYFLLGMTVLVGLLLIIKNRRVVYIQKKGAFLFFVSYYVVVSMMGLFTNYVGIKNFIELLLKYILLPLIIFKLIPQDYNERIKMLKLLKSIIFVCCIYGFIESVIKYNYLVYFVRTDRKIWMEAMNITSNYQPCSIFLHYNYYGCVLVLGLVFAWFLPYKRKILNIVYWVILLEQILICQSRMCWIAAIILVMLKLGKSKKITSNTIKKLLLIMMACVCLIIFDPTIFSIIGRFVKNRFSRLWIYGFEDGSLGQRLGTLMNWPNYFQKNTIKGLVGTGYQSILVDYMRKYSFFKGYSTADCQLTVYLVETGVIGVVILGVALVSFFRKRSMNSLEAQIICKISKMALFAFCIECITLDIVSNNVIWSLLLMIVVVFTKRQKCEIA